MTRLVVAAALAISAVLAQADDTPPAERTLPFYKAQAIDQLDGSLQAGWLNPNCILLVVKSGAFLVSNEGVLSACTEQCASLAARGLLVPGRVEAPGGVAAQYRITPAALKYLEPHMSNPPATKLCAAHATLATLDYLQTRGADIEGDFDQLTAGYRVQLGAPADWALDPAVRKGFPVLTSPADLEQQVFEANFAREGANLVLERQ